MLGFRYARPLSLKSQPAMDAGAGKTCAGLLQSLFPDINSACYWRRGAKVRCNKLLLPGVAIAVFDAKGLYAGRHGHHYSKGEAHAGLYVGQTDEGIWIIHQHEQSGGFIRQAFVRFNGKKADITKDKPFKGVSGVSGGSSILLEDKGDQYYVIKVGDSCAH